MSPWASPIAVVPKKSQPGEPPKKRLCIDFRKINDLQQKVITGGKSKGCLSLIPLPKIDKMYAKLKGAKFFSTIVLRSGYYHIALGKDSRAKTAFVMPFGKYKFLQVPFGLAQAPAFFQHLMNKVLDNCPFAMTYLDDIIIFSDTEEEHFTHRGNLQETRSSRPEDEKIQVQLLPETYSLSGTFNLSQQYPTP